MASFLSSIAEIATAVFAWFGQVVDLIVQQPVLLLFCSLGVISLVFGLVLRFVRGV
jgi:hypothetical protein